VEDILCTRKEKTLERIGLNRWGLTEEQSRKFSEVQLEDDYSRHSRRALEKLLPHLKDGLTYPEAVQKAYPGRNTGIVAVDELPPLDKWGTVRNPIVERSLTELRHLVNALIRRYGKPPRSGSSWRAT